MLGKIELARQIDDHLTNHGYKAPKGWRFVGSGGTRSCYLGPDGVVYKVGDAWCNSNEAKASQKLRRSKTLAKNNIYVAQTRAIKLGIDNYGDEIVVNAQQFIKPSKTKVYCGAMYGRECTCKSKFGLCAERVYELLEELDIEDMFAGNILWQPVEKKMYIIDLGFQE